MAVPFGFGSWVDEGNEDVAAAAARQAAAERMLRSVKPPGGRKEGYLTNLPEDLMIPKTPLDAGLMLAGGLPGRALKVGAMALGAAMTGDEANAGPISAIRKAAKPFGSLAPEIEAPAATGIRAYHGSPHDFDRFDLSKIGTGEGAQSYGHGLYFAENEATAKAYREALALRHNGMTIEGVSGKRLNDMTGAERQAYAILANDRGDIERSIARSADAMNAGDVRSVLERWKRDGRVEFPKGRMYEVNISAKPEQFLDWDKPISQQSGLVQKSVPKLNVEARSIGTNPKMGEELFDVAARGGGSLGAFPKSRLDEVMSNPSRFDPRTGGMLYESRALVPGEYADKTAASKALLERGIPGIKYFDQGSRGFAGSVIEPVQKGEFAGKVGEWRITGRSGSSSYFPSKKAAEEFLEKETTSNYVLFDDKLVDILRKYALPGAVGAGGFGSLTPGDQ